MSEAEEIQQEPARLAPSTVTGGLDTRGAIAFVAGWLVPGAGHAFLGRWVRAVCLFVILTGAYALGVMLNGRLYTIDGSGYLAYFFAFANAGSGLIYGCSLLAGIGLNVNAQNPTYEYGSNLMLVTGLLNYLVALNAYDIAVGRKP
jgi:hypothetical protein